MSMSTAFSGVYCDQGSDGDEDDSSIETNEASVLNAVGLSVVYNKTRELYFLNCEMFCKQLDKWVVATCPVQVESKPTSCVWCCQKTHDQPTRSELSTKFRCPVCIMVSLCHVKRFNGTSSHELLAVSYYKKLITDRLLLQSQNGCCGACCLSSKATTPSNLR